MNEISCKPIRELFDTLWDLTRSGIITDGFKTWFIDKRGYTANIEFTVTKTRTQLKRTFTEPTPEKLQETVMAAIQSALCA